MKCRARLAGRACNGRCNGDAESAAIVKALAGLGNGLGLTVVAEGIETSSERDTLLHDGCQQGQGFLFSPAVPAKDTASFFAPRSARGSLDKRLSA